MATQGVTLMCYWNGRMTKGPHGISYEGAEPKPIRVHYGITYNELLDKMYKITGFDKQLFKLKVICRYPACRECIPVPIYDDESIDIMFDVARQPGTNCMELYLERAPVQINNQLNERPPVHSDNHINERATLNVDNQENVTAQAHIVRQTSVEIGLCDYHADSFLDPGPVDNVVLVLQHKHRSEAIWRGQDPGVLTCRQRLATTMREWPLDKRLHRCIIQSGFYGLYRVGFIQLHWPLITALVERWRQETHTFHLAVGESTVTLQDAAVLLGLRIQGHAVTGSCNLQWDDLCEELLGLRPDRAALQGSALKLSWLRAHFQQPPQNADSETLQCYARAYILALMGGLLFADKSGSDVQLIFLPLLRDFAYAGQLSWGSAALALLYRELCRASRMGAIEIAGPLVLLQLWAWERMPIGRPDRLDARMQDPVVLNDVDIRDATVDEEPLPKDPLGCRWRFSRIHRDNPDRALIFYRDQLDQQRDDQMIWQPYTAELLTLLPDVCVSDQQVWRTVAPLICFDIVEWHRPDRVLRQFGLCQGIPVCCDTEMTLHAIDKRGRHNYNWQSYHRRYVELWMAREDTIATGELEDPMMHYPDMYLEWYHNITRRFINPINQRTHKRFQPTSGTLHMLVKRLTDIHHRSTTTLDAFTTESSRRALQDIQTMCLCAFEMIGESQHLETRLASPPEGSSHSDDTEGPSHATNEDAAPAPAPAPLLTMSAAQSVRGRGGGKGDAGRGRGASHVEAEAAVFPVASSHLVSEEAALPTTTLMLGTTSVPMLRGGGQKRGGASSPLAHADSMERLLQLNQMGPNHESRAKKKKKKSKPI